MEPRPLTEFPRAAAAAVHTVLADIDDTLTTDGRLTAQAYGAIEALRTAGLRVVPVTGRPAGWCDHIARMWPVDAVIGENGAFWMWHDDRGGKLRARHLLDDAGRADFARRLAAVRERVLREVPGCATASDQFCRLYDLAIDFREDVAPLPRADVDRIVALMEAEGLTAKVSSIHVNGWFGGYDKLTTTRALFADAFGTDLDADRARYVFAGDSPNDAPMFGYFPLAVGMANVRPFLDRIATPPAYVTEEEAGTGFVQLADFLLEGLTLNMHSTSC